MIKILRISEVNSIRFMHLQKYTIREIADKLNLDITDVLESSTGCYPTRRDLDTMEMVAKKLNKDIKDVTVQEFNSERDNVWISNDIDENYDLLCKEIDYCLDDYLGSLKQEFANSSTIISDLLRGCSEIKNDKKIQRIKKRTTRFMRWLFKQLGKR